MQPNNEQVGMEIDQFSEEVVKDMLAQASSIGQLYGVSDGLAFMQMVGIKTLRNVLANSIGCAKPDATEEELREFHDNWISDIADFLKVEEGVSLVKMRSDIDAQQKD